MKMREKTQDVYTLYVRMSDNTVYVYRDPRVPYLIVKRTPFSYQIPTVDKEGYEVVQFLQGQAIKCPYWAETTVSGSLVFARAHNKMFEISDLAQK